MNKSLETFRKLSESIPSRKTEIDEDFLGFGKISKFVNAKDAITFEEDAENTYALHYRVSTDKQAKDGESLETQERLALQIVKDKNGKVFKIYKEEGVSASKKRLYERKVMMEMLKDFQKGHFKNIISYNQDRLFRNDKEAPIALQLLFENGANIYYTRGGVNELVNRETLGAYGMSRIQDDANRAKQETISTSNRVADTRRAMFADGKIVQNFYPYGYRKNEEGKNKDERRKAIQIKEEIEMIKEVEELYLDGVGFSTIAKWLNGEKARKIPQRPTKFIRRKIRKDDSDRWTKETVKGLLFNKFYHGILTNNFHGQVEEEVESIDHTPFRTKERYEELVNFKKEKKSKNKPARHYDSDFLLKKLLYCNHCGKPFYTRQSTKPNGQPHQYYYCKSVADSERLGTHICKNKNYNKEMIETFVLLKIKNYLAKFDLSLFTIDMTKSIDEEDKKLLLMVDDCDKQISKLINKEKTTDNRIDDQYDDIDSEENEDRKAILKEELQKLKNKKINIALEIKELKAKRSQLQEDIEKDNSSLMDTTHIFNKMLEFVNDFENVMDYRKQRLIEEIINKIIIDNSGNIEIQYKVDLEEMVKSVTEMAVTTQDAFYGDVSELTTPKSTHDLHHNKPLYIKAFEHIDDSNYRLWLEEIYIEARSKFKEFLIGTTLKYTENGRINAWQLANKTGISHYTARAYFNYSHFPTKEKMIQVLKPYNATTEDFVNFLNLDNYINSNLLFEIINVVNKWYKDEKVDESIIREEVNRRVEKYKEKDTLNRQVIYSNNKEVLELV